MIEDPPLLQIRREFQRPVASDLAALAGLQTGYITDAMGGRGALDHRIKPLAPLHRTLVGVAVTCHCGPADNLALFGALHAARAGDILIAATDGFTGTAVTGDLAMGMARNRGVAGLVTDGMVRDVAGILTVGLPVFCAGVTPNSPARNGPGEVGLPVVLGGVAVESGDVIVADNDGVVVVSRSKLVEVLARLPAIRAAEAELEARVKGGLEIPGFFQDVIDSGRVRDIP
jgi:4-hydroxy-4-methyl-2-oxoglutarate aldolase